MGVFALSRCTENDHVATGAIKRCSWCISGALTSLNILSNDIGVEQANALIETMKSKDNLNTLCGFSGGETELDLSGKGLTAGCGVLVANEIKNNGAMTSLNLNLSSRPLPSNLYVKTGLSLMGRCPVRQCRVRCGFNLNVAGRRAG